MEVRQVGADPDPLLTQLLPLGSHQPAAKLLSADTHRVAPFSALTPAHSEVSFLSAFKLYLHFSFPYFCQKNLNNITVISLSIWLLGWEHVWLTLLF